MLFGIHYYMQTVTSAENGGTEKADFQVPRYIIILCFHVTSPILGECISTILIPQQRKPELLVKSYQIFKKGSKLQALNYRPVSLTCKLFENIWTHLEDHTILTDLQHGVRIR